MSSEDSKATSSVTVFVISSGEESEADCIKALEAQQLGTELAISIEHIRDVTPMSEAFNEMHRRSKTPFFIQVDADMILNPTAVRTLYEGLHNASFFTYAAYGQLYEEGFGMGNSVRCWRKSFFKLFQFRDRRTVDRDLYKRAAWLGFRRKDLKTQVGIHRPRHSIYSEYLKTKADVEKWRFLGRPPEQYAVPLLNKLLETEGSSPALFGALCGAMTEWPRVRRSKDSVFEKQQLSEHLRKLGVSNLDSLHFTKLNGPEAPQVVSLFANAYRGNEHSARELSDLIRRRKIDDHERAR